MPKKERAFPTLISRRQYNQRRKLAAVLGEEIRKDIAIAMDGKEDVFSVDSQPVKVCRNARANRCTMGRDDSDRAPQWGCCASQGLRSFGY